MKIPYGALTCIVEGEVQPGRAAGASAASAASSGALRAVAPGANEMQVFREAQGSNQVGYLAADLHFATVLWVARIDSRIFDFDSKSNSVSARLAAVTDALAERAGVRVDRSVRASSLASFADQAPPMRVNSWPPRSRATPRPALRHLFTAGGEAERAARRAI